MAEITLGKRAVCWRKRAETPPPPPPSPSNELEEATRTTTPAAPAPDHGLSGVVSIDVLDPYLAKLDGAPRKHAVSAYTRPLTEAEEAIIRDEFLRLNGVFEPSKKDCTRIKGLLPDEVTVFQVSGYVTKLHKRAKAGELEMPDRQAYLNALNSHRKQWLTYNGEKYDAMRGRYAQRPQLVPRAPALTASRPRHKVQ